MRTAVVAAGCALALAAPPAADADDSHLLDRAANRRAATIARLNSGERQLEGPTDRARTARDAQRRLAERQRKKRPAARTQLYQVQRLVASMSREERAGVDRLEERRAGRAQRGSRRSGALGHRALAPSRAGDRALRYAIRQLGKPYEWGAEGPDSFDCSGLTSEAWRHAGLIIPRTSQEQWKQLPRVPMDELRPGDLVIYFRGATHVAMYIGGGQVVQAPRPGAVVKVSPIAANPVLGAVRPDMGAVPMVDYDPPEIPKEATKGANTGYSSPVAPPSKERRVGAPHKERKVASLSKKRKAAPPSKKRKVASPSKKPKAASPSKKLKAPPPSKERKVTPPSRDGKHKSSARLKKVAFARPTVVRPAAQRTGPHKAAPTRLKSKAAPTRPTAKAGGRHTPRR